MAWPTWPRAEDIDSGLFRGFVAEPCGKFVISVLSTGRKTISTRPPQHGRSLGRGAPTLRCSATLPAMMRLAWSIRIYSSWPPPIVPAMASIETSMKAPSSRGAEPMTEATIDKDFCPSLSESGRDFCHGAMRSSAVRLPSERAPASSAVSRRGQDAVVGHAGNRHGDCLDHRDRQDERRFADGLGAADGRQLVDRPIRRVPR